MTLKGGDKKFPCRYGCGVMYKTRSGQRYHEIHTHGKLWKIGDSVVVRKHDDTDKSEKNEISEVDNNTDYVKIKEVKYMVAKKVNAKETTEEYECGKCGEKFGELKKFCPNCGCEFE